MVTGIEGIRNRHLGCGCCWQLRCKRSQRSGGSIFFPTDSFNKPLCSSCDLPGQFILFQPDPDCRGYCQREVPLQDVGCRSGNLFTKPGKFPSIHDSSRGLQNMSNMFEILSTKALGNMAEELNIFK